MMGESTPKSTLNKTEESKCGQFVNKPLFQRIVFELSVVIYLAVTNLAIPLTQQYLYYIVGKKHIQPGLENGTSQQDGVLRAPVNISGDVNLQIEQETTLLVLYLNMAELFPTALCVLILGFYSDIRGKRCLLIWLPCLGNVVYGLGYLLPLYISGGDVDHPATKPLLFGSTLFYGITGNLAGFTVGISSYISDTDTVERRSLRLSLAQTYYCVTYAISNYGSSKWIQDTGDFTGPFWVFVGCSLVVMIMCLLFLNDPECSDTLQSRVKSTKDGIIGIKDLFRCDTTKRKTMWLVLLAFIAYGFVQQGQERTTVLFLKNNPLNWNDDRIGTFYLVRYLISAFGILPCVPLMAMCLDEAVINIVAMLSFMAGSLVLAFAKTPALIYFSGVVKIFHQVPWASARSLTSKQAGEHEQGSVYAVMHFGQLIMLFLGTASYNAMFFATLDWMNGFIFAISAVFLIPSVIFLMCARFLTKSREHTSLPSDEIALTESDTLVSTITNGQCFGSVESTNQ